MFRPTALALLAAMAAANPAFAQAGACMPHGGEEVRCAVRLHTGASSVTRVVQLDLPGQVAGPIRAQADTYTSTCGSRGNMVGTTQLEAGRNLEVARFVHNPGTVLEGVQMVSGLCVETFLRNCTVGNQRMSCTQALNLGASRIIVN